MKSNRILNTQQRKNAFERHEHIIQMILAWFLYYERKVFVPLTTIGNSSICRKKFYDDKVLCSINNGILPLIWMLEWFRCESVCKCMNASMFRNGRLDQAHQNKMYVILNMFTGWRPLLTTFNSRGKD